MSGLMEYVVIAVQVLVGLFVLLLLLDFFRTARSGVEALERIADELSTIGRHLGEEKG